MDDVRRAAAVWQSKCAREKPWLAFGLAQHILTMPAELGSRESQYQQDLFASVREVDAPRYVLFTRAMEGLVDASRQQALALLNVARFLVWLSDTSQSSSFACTSGHLLNQVLAVLREDQKEWPVFWRAAVVAASGCLSSPKRERARRAWCDTALHTQGFDPGRLGRSLQLDIARECAP
jgi:hypothetical protein